MSNFQRVEQKQVAIPIVLCGLVSSVLRVDAQDGAFYSHSLNVASEDKYTKQSVFVIENDAQIAQPGEEIEIQAEVSSNCYDRPFTYTDKHKKAGQQGLYREGKTKIRFVKRLQ